MSYLPVPSDFQAPVVSRWYRISHICRLWRKVALDCPTLWRHLDLTSPRWAQEMLARSKQATISLRAEVYSTRPLVVDTCMLMLCRTLRLGELHITGDHPTVNTIVQPLCGLYAENLRSLILRTSHWRFDADLLEIPPTLLSGGTPRLQVLKLWRCSISWDSPLLTKSINIVQLSLQGIRRAVGRPSMQQLTNILKHMPKLQYLYLEDVLPNLRDASSPNVR